VVRRGLRGDGSFDGWRQGLGHHGSRPCRSLQKTQQKPDGAELRKKREFVHCSQRLMFAYIIVEKWSPHNLDLTGAFRPGFARAKVPTTTGQQNQSASLNSKTNAQVARVRREPHEKLNPRPDPYTAEYANYAKTGRAGSGGRSHSLTLAVTDRSACSYEETALTEPLAYARSYAQNRLQAGACKTNGVPPQKDSRVCANPYADRSSPSGSGRIRGPRRGLR